MKKSFTLIEVLIAVTILAIVGSALLQGANQSLDFVEKIVAKEKKLFPSFIAALHRKKEYSGIEKPLKSYLLDYSIDDLELRGKLAQTKIKIFIEEEKNTFKELDEESLEDEENSSELFNITLLRITTPAAIFYGLSE